jgi:hypothetical protein
MSNFVFNNISSHIFGLVIGFSSTQGIEEINTYSDMQIITDRSARRVEPYYFGRRLPESLEFGMEIYNKHGMHYEMHDVQTIQEWLFGRAEPHYLSILDPDKGNESYLCWLVSPQIVKVDNKVIGWKFQVMCASPYSETDIIESMYHCTTPTSEIEYYNLSNVEEYLYPELSIRMLGTASFILIENLNDNDRIFQITNIRAGTSIYVNNDYQYMIADNGDNVFQNFNLNWFRFSPGFNRLFISGTCELTFKHRFKKAVGGY